MQIKMTNWMQNISHSKGKVSGIQMSGLNNSKTGDVKKKVAGNANAATVDLS